MHLIQAVILGIVEGITEFLPISSTAHLIIASKLLGLAQTNFQTLFEVFIQSGAILAVILLYAQYLLTKKDVLINVILSFIPTALVGFVLQKIIKTVFFQSFNLILLSMALIAFVFLIIEWKVKKNSLKLTKSIQNVTLKDALLIGLFQSLAVVPGVSRAGIVIVSMMGMKYKRDEAAQYSFLLAIPTILAASLLDLYKSRNLVQFDGATLLVLGIGFIVSFVTAYMVIRWFIRFLQSHTLEIFAYYRLILAIILVLIFGI